MQRRRVTTRKQTKLGSPKAQWRSAARGAGPGPRPDATTLLIVRHGQTKWNVLGRVQGATDTPLDTVGLDQAQWVARRLASSLVPIAAVYTSDLARALQTALIIREHLEERSLAGSGSPGPPLRSSFDLREIGYGEWEGKTRAEIEAAGQGEALRRWQAGYPLRAKAIEQPVPPGLADAEARERDEPTLPAGAETREEALERVDRILTCVAPRHAGETIVVVGHGGTLRLMLCRLLGWAPEQWAGVRIANTGVSKAVLVPGRRPWVAFVNNTDHLPGSESGRLAGPLQS